MLKPTEIANMHPSSRAGMASIIFPKPTDREMTATERRECAWTLIKCKVGSQDQQSKKSGLAISRIADFRRLWKYIQREYPETADRITCDEALALAKVNGVRNHRSPVR